MLLNYTVDEEQTWALAPCSRPLELVMARLPGNNTVGRIFLRWRDTQQQVPFHMAPVHVRIESNDEPSLDIHDDNIFIVQYAVYRVYVQGALTLTLTPLRKQIVESITHD